MGPYPGAADLVSDSTWPNLFAAALAELPTTSGTWQDFAPLILPYGIVPLAWDGPGSIMSDGSLRVMDGVAVFSHPQNTGTLTVHAVAVGYAESDSWLIAIIGLDSPPSTGAVGDTLTIPLTLLALADPSSE